MHAAQVLISMTAAFPMCLLWAYITHRYPEEALTRTQALRGMTCDAAYAAFAEDTRGRLAPGFAADFVVLDRDIMRVPLQEILGTKVLATVVDGQVMYGSL
jgi:predicted amidohydrolase YtcJ